MKPITKWRLSLHLQAKKNNALRLLRSLAVKSIGVENLFLFFVIVVFLF